MKNIIFVNGTMGVGKTTVCRELQKILPQNVFLDGDWCWDALPFVVTDETKRVVIDNIIHIINNYISCSVYQNIIFCWVMHEQSIIDSIINKLNMDQCDFKLYTLSADENTVRERLNKDIISGIRTASVIERSLERLPKYDEIKSEKIATDGKDAVTVAEEIASKIIRIYR